MEPFFSAGGAEPAEREAMCPEHGRFMSRRVLKQVWTRCQACEQSAARREIEEAAQEQRRAGILRAGIAPRFVRSSFENYIAHTDEQKHALTVARDFAEGLGRRSRKGNGLVFLGQPGTGKTHLASAILLAHLPSRIRYTTTMDLIRGVRDTWHRGSGASESKVLDEFGSLDLLVIDEVGTQYGTEGEQNVLFDVLDRRYRDECPTVLVTNQNTDGVRRCLGERSFDRLKETCRWIAFDWPSHRPIARIAAQSDT